MKTHTRSLNRILFFQYSPLYINLYFLSFRGQINKFFISFQRIMHKKTSQLLLFNDKQQKATIQKKDRCQPFQNKNILILVKRAYFS